MDSVMFGRNDWNGNGSYDYSDRAMDMMSMRYVMTDGTWEDDDDIAHAEREDDHREESRDWDDDDRDEDDDDDEYDWDDDDRDYDDE